MSNLTSHIEEQQGQGAPVHPAETLRAFVLSAFEPWMLRADPEPDPEPTWLYRLGYPFGRVLGAFVYVWTEILDGARVGFNDGRW